MNIASSNGIKGPVAAGQPPQRGLIAGCLSGCASALTAVGVVVAGAAGMAFEVVQPDHAVTQTVPDGSCTFSWWRSALGGARYRIRCDATKPLELSSFKLLSGPAGVDLVEAVEDWGQRPWEDQRPMSGQTITVNAGRDWTYNGTISLGVVPYLGPPAKVTLTAIVDEQKLEFLATD